MTEKKLVINATGNSAVYFYTFVFYLFRINWNEDTKEKIIVDYKIIRFI